MTLPFHENLPFRQVTLPFLRKSPLGSCLSLGIFEQVFWGLDVFPDTNQFGLKRRWQPLQRQLNSCSVLYLEVAILCCLLQHNCVCSHSGHAFYNLDISSYFLRHILDCLHLSACCDVAWVLISLSQELDSKVCIKIIYFVLLLSW